MTDVLCHRVPQQSWPSHGFSPKYVSPFASSHPLTPPPPFQIVKSAPETTADGGYSYFDGGLIHYDLEHTSEKYVIHQIFKANNKHTGNGRGSTAVPPYHYHPYQDELFTVVSPACSFSLDAAYSATVFTEKRNAVLHRERQGGTALQRRINDESRRRSTHRESPDSAICATTPI